MKQLRQISMELCEVKKANVKSFYTVWFYYVTFLKWQNYTDKIIEVECKVHLNL